MSHPLRRIAAESLVAVALCALAHDLLVRPVEQQLEVGTARYKSLITHPANAAENFSPPQLEQLDRLSATYRDEIARRSLHARDESLMFGAIMTLASEHNVRVDQVRPTQSAVAGSATPLAVAPSPQGTLAPSPTAPKDISIGYTIAVAGQYSDLADFIEGLSLRTGFSVISSVRLTADDADAHHPVAAQIQTEHFAFDLDPASTLAAASETAAHEGGSPR